MRQIAVVTAHDAPYQALADVTLPVLEAYCKRHEYNLWYEHDLPAIEKDLGKSRIFRQLYEGGQFGPDDLYLWVDTDAVPLNHAIKAEDVWDAHADANTHFLWSYNFDGPNSGVFMARFTEEADNFIRAYGYEQAAMGWGDNNAMNLKMMLPPFRDWVKCIPGIHMNSGPFEEYGLSRRPRSWKRSVNGYEPGDWILHCAGIEEPRRTEVLKKYISMMIDVQAFEVPAGIPETPAIDIFPVPAWVTLRGLEEALKTPRGLHESSDWGIWNAVYCGNEYGLGELKEGDVVLDLGASTGPFATLAYERGSRNIVAYEMDAGTFAVLQQNIDHLGANGAIQIYNKAVVGTNDVARYYIPLGMCVTEDNTPSSVPVKCVEFDDVLSPLKAVRFLKIDIEGCEWDIFYGSAQLHKIQEISGEYHPQSRSGCNPETLESFLRQRGFQTKFIVKEGIGDFRAWR